MRTAFQIFLVAFGSSLGGLTRWGVTVWFGRWFGTAFPWGTLFINLSGSLFLGWFTTALTERFAFERAWLRADDLLLIIAVGFTGAFTTFSTFEFESHRLLSDGDRIAGAAYIALSVFVGLLAVRAGVLLARVGGGSAI
ncbi:MAG: fluoride efflux transporter FluC [Gemmataceae bacterium]